MSVSWLSSRQGYKINTFAHRSYKRTKYGWLEPAATYALVKVKERGKRKKEGESKGKKALSIQLVKELKSKCTKRTKQKNAPPILRLSIGASKLYSIWKDCQVDTCTVRWMKKGKSINFIMITNGAECSAKWMVCWCKKSCFSYPSLTSLGNSCLRKQMSELPWDCCAKQTFNYQIRWSHALKHTVSSNRRRYRWLIRPHFPF